MSEAALIDYIRELKNAISQAQEGKGRLPFQHGLFIVSARAGGVDIEIQDITEEDAILIRADLRSRGIRAIMRASIICPNCQRRVPAQMYCTSCRHKLKGTSD